MQTQAFWAGAVLLPLSLETIEKEEALNPDASKAQAQELADPGAAVSV